MITNTEETKNILEEMKLLNSWSENTYRMYKQAIKKYTTFHSMNMYQLIQEAEDDEEHIIKVNKRRIKQRLVQFILHLQEQGASKNTIRAHLSKIKKIYKHHDIELPEIPTPRASQEQENYKDLPTNDEISRAILHSKTKTKALITFMASCGLRRSDVAKLTVGDFIEATREYHDCTTITETLKALQRRQIIVPTWNIVTVKTKTPLITFNSHEATLYIMQMLKERLMKKEVCSDDKLFELEPYSITKAFERVNERLDFGWKGNRRRFHAHAMRKFFSTTLTINDVDYLTTEFLIGHKLKGSSSAYYFANPEKLKNKYVRVMDKLTFTIKLEYIDIDSREKRELEELRVYKRESSERIRRLEEALHFV